MTICVNRILLVAQGYKSHEMRNQTSPNLVIDYFCNVFKELGDLRTIDSAKFYSSPPSLYRTTPS
ncbi:hypothetical protein EON65_42920, partial [archaeon]